MFNPGSLFRERLRAHIKLLNRYLRYIFNGHFMIAILFIIVTLAIYYQRWLADVSPAFPAAVVIAIAFSFIVLYNPIQSFLKEPDKVFIAVQEQAMDRYFTYSLLYNYGVQLYIIVFVIAAVWPLYFTFYPERGGLVNVLIIATILLMKGWNLTLDWRLLQNDQRMFVLVERIVRMALTFTLFYALITFQFFLIVGVVYVVYINIVYFYLKKERRLHWERLIHNDAERLAKFYRFVSLFAEVPHIKNRLRKRRLLTGLVHGRTPFSKNATFSYLYWLTFFRSGDYFSLFVRLTVIGVVVIIFIPNIWLKLALAILFMYMTSFQLQTLFHHYRTNVWLELYPLNPDGKKKAFLTLAMQVSQVQVILLAGSFLVVQEWMLFVVMLLVGTLFNIAFHRLYVERKIGAVETY